jgi:hypothetical protein
LKLDARALDIGLSDDLRLEVKLGTREAMALLLELIGAAQAPAQSNR